VLAVPAVVGIAFLVLPLAALVGRVQWTTLWQDVTSTEALDALRLSLVTGLIATVVCLLGPHPLRVPLVSARENIGSVVRGGGAVSRVRGRYGGAP
jgi:molybdate transport system permease protein